MRSLNHKKGILLTLKRISSPGVDHALAHDEIQLHLEQYNSLYGNGKRPEHDQLLRLSN
jgi:hypothetical protein